MSECCNDCKQKCELFTQNWQKIAMCKCHTSQQEEGWEKKLDKWLDTEEHLHDCIGYSEGMACCMDKTSNGVEKEGRKFIKNLFKSHQEEAIAKIEGLLSKYAYEPADLCSNSQQFKDQVLADLTEALSILKGEK